MALKEPITFVAAVNNNEILQNNLLSSPLFRRDNSHQILRQENFPSASKAYNAGIDQAANDLIVFAHQDVFLPQGWLNDLAAALAQLENDDPNWGVLGCGGVTEDGETCGFVYSTGLGVLGRPFGCTKAIQTLDEIVLILRKSSGLRFDDTLPNFHFYGTDICMEAKRRGRKSYVMSTFVIHNTNEILELNRDFYDCYKHVKKRWRKDLPIHTTCIVISKFDRAVYEMKLRQLYGRIFRRARKPSLRVQDPRQILQRLLAENRLHTGDLHSGSNVTCSETPVTRLG